MSGRLVLVMNGPNLNLLGDREPEIYGTTRLSDIERDLEPVASELGLTLEHVQSNHEGALVEAIQGARQRCAAIVVNAGAFTHSSWAMADALSTYEGYVVEVHISNPYARESWRHTSVITPVADAGLEGFGPFGYELALRAVQRHLDRVAS